MRGMKLGPKLNKLLDLRGWSQERLRESMKEPVSSGTMSNWVAGKGPLPRIDQAYEIAKLLECDLMYLADDEIVDIQGTRRTSDDDELIAIARRLGYQLAFDRLLQKENVIKHARVLTPEESRARRGE